LSGPVLYVGDPAPRFIADSSLRPAHAVDLQAGRYLVLTFADSGKSAEGLASAFAALPSNRELPVQQWFVLPDRPGEQPGAGAGAQLRYFLDPRGEIRQAYGVATDVALTSFILTPRLHVAAIIAESDLGQHIEQVGQRLAAQAPIGELAEYAGQAPVLIIPGVFEPDFCRMLIDGYKRHGGEASSFARDEAGRTVHRLDSGFKVRRDWLITEPTIQRQVEARFIRRVVPEIRRAYQFEVAHLERHLVACYDAAEGGHFAAHRDNTGRGTEHRRFACSLNLNDDYDGGTLIFPEFGTRQFRPAPGACVIFSASLLHQANRVTAGQRFAYLPFLHDSAAEEVFARNRQFIDEATVGSGSAGAAG
jgi:predicted 2-oxoglutarate/Fe(II)-dependent dioxygenase YbiX